VRRAAILLSVAFVATPDIARGWETLYASFEPAVTAAPGPAEADAAICLRAILDAQERHGIPDNLLLGIGLQEAGTRRDGTLTVWPWAVNAAGEGRLFDTAAEAMAWVRQRQEAGVASIDVGCLQINLRWHPDAFQSLDEGFTPALNADYAARFLRGLYEQTGDWRVAAGSYHSFTPELRDIYLASLEQNLNVANERRETFAALARSVPGTSSDVRSLAPPAAPIQGGFWAAALSDGTGAGRRGLYSRTDIKPILPRFSDAP
jgi:hypothetical protein